jgi:acyl-coenzyme A thioesterase PaaI-like protein
MTIEFTHDDISNTELERRESIYGPLAATVRDLVDVTIRTTVPEEDIRAAQAEIEAIVERLRSEQLPGPAGVRYNSDARSWSWGNAAIGLRNAAAPPLTVIHEDAGHAHADVTLGAAYEGPPGRVHGGVSALLLDHVMGETASAGFSRATFTGTLTIRYRRGTPLGPIRLEAHIDREEDRKVFVVASISDSEGITVEADGIFIIPAGRVEQ